MKYKNTLESISHLMEYKNKDDSSEFTLIEEQNAIYVNFGHTKSKLYEAYSVSKEIATVFNVTVVLNFQENIMVVDKNSMRKDIEEQFEKGNDIMNRLYIEEKLIDITKKLNTRNAKKVCQLLKNEDILEEYLSDYQFNNLSHALIDLYKSTLPDAYLDGMVEKAKAMKKQRYRKRGMI